MDGGAPAEICTGKPWTASGGTGSPPASQPIRQRSGSPMTNCAARLLIAATCCVVANPVIAQTARPDSVRLRNDCRLAEQVLTRGHPADKKDWAWGVIPLCGDRAVAPLVRIWQSRSVSSERLGALVSATAELPDRRLYGELRRIAEDAGAPAQLRVAAIVAQAAYVVPQVGGLGALAVPDRSGGLSRS